MLLNEIKIWTNCLTGDLSIVRLLTIIIFQGMRMIIPLYLIVKAIINLGKCETSKEIIIAKKQFIETLIKATIIYLIFTFVQFGISLLADFFSGNTWICIRNLISF